MRPCPMKNLLWVNGWILAPLPLALIAATASFSLLNLIFQSCKKIKKKIL